MSSSHRLQPRRSRSALIVVAVVVALLIAAGVVAAARGAIGHGDRTASNATSVVGTNAKADTETATLPSWAIGPFTRYQHNPILTSPVVPSAATSWEWPEVFNPGVVVVDGTFHMLYRGTDFAGVSAIGAATSENGYQFTPVSDRPVITPTLPSETAGVEDPRLYYLAGKYYSFFTGDLGSTQDINEAVSTNGRSWTQLGPVLTNTKDAAVVASPEGRPVRINGHFLMYYGQLGGTYLAESTNLTNWATIGTVATRLPASYEPWEFCVAVTNYQTVAGGAVHRDIDMFVAGGLMGNGRWYYAISEIEFTRANRRAAGAHLDVAVLSPHASYEVYGHTPRTVYMNDIIFYGGQWRMYYGAGDSVIGLATAKLR